MSAPVNDDYADATVLAGLSGSAMFDLVEATIQPEEEPLPSGVSLSAYAGTVWFEWAPAADGSAHLTVSDGTGFGGTGLDIYARGPTLAWLATDPNASGTYQGAFLKLYRVQMLRDLAADDYWVGPELPDDDIAGDPRAEGVHVDLFTGDPGPVADVGYDVASWPRAAHTETSPEGYRHAVLAGPLVRPAGNWVYLLVQQWPQTYGSEGGLDVMPDRAVDWQPDVEGLGDWASGAVLQTEGYYGSNGDAQAAVFDMTTLEQVPLDVRIPVNGWPVAAGGVADVVFTTRVEESYLIRAYPMDGSGGGTGLTLTWDLVASGIAITLVTPVLATSPGVLQLHVTDEPAGEVLSFTVDSDPTVLATVTVPADGTVQNLPVPVPALTNGAHSVIATGDTGRVGSAGFTVAAEEYQPDDPADPAPPPPAEQPPETVTRWVFSDPTDDTTWTFPVNPKSADSPLLGRTLTAEVTTAVDGQPVIFEGGRRAKRWTVTGQLLTQADVDELREWKKPYLVYLIDDLGRAFVVKVLGVAATAVRDARFPELHDVKLTCLLYGRAAA